MNLQYRRAAVLAISTSAAALVAFPAFAYVGPGAGLTLLGALWGLVVAVVVSLGFVLLWPLRRMMRRNKRAQPPADDDPTHSMLSNPSGDREDRRM
ncbi:hypothetical protein [Dongia deserti]|uniref:hypothetical protein n=1 Tax=Dongia deserti TaxID=2268030 RepID=UPI0025465C2C|nr:hypothetical protein [Dongia deserti]